jgi:iron complex transport system substrate-binding protein
MARRPRILSPNLAALLLAALLLAACARGAPGSLALPTAATSASATDAPASGTPRATGNFPMTVTDDAGRRVALDAEPRTIISLAPSNTEILCALGACDRIVGVNDFRDGLPDEVTATIAGVPNVASFTGVDREAIVNLGPDLVLAAGNELTSSADIAALTRLGIPVLVLYPQSLDAVYADIELVGAAIGAPLQASALTGQMRGRVRAVSEVLAGADAPRTFYEVGVYEGAIYTAGADSFLASLIELAGGMPITGDATTTAIQLEDLVAADPQLILLGDAAYDASITPDAVAARPGWGGMSAVREGRVLGMPNDVLITRPGPRIVDGLEALARAIHPEAFD